MGIYADYIFPTIESFFTKRLRRERKRLLRFASGSVLEIGAGAGHNFEFATDRVNHLASIELNPWFVKHAKVRSSSLEASDRIGVFKADAHNFPFAANSFDTVISFLVLCSVSNPAEVLAESFRVIKPGGRLLVFEHVRSSNQRTEKLQNMLNPMWRFLCCGCNLNRNTALEIKTAGFKPVKMKEYRSSRMGPQVTSNVIEGVALRP